jgi:hypothetical protein
MAFIDWFRGLLVGLLTLLLALPFITTLLLILRGDRRRRHVLAVAALHPGADVGNGQKRPPNGRPAEKAVSNRASH